MTTADDDFLFRPAVPSDEPEIRALVGSTPMPGAISVRFEREPNYFHGCDVMGDVCEVLTARHAPDGELAGVLCRTERRAFVNGREEVVGGIGQVRIAPRFRGHHLLARGWSTFRRRELLYVGVIARGNEAAVRSLVGRAPGGPCVRPLSGLTTLAIVVRRAGRRSAPAIAPSSTQVALDEVVSFLREHGPRRQLFPSVRADDLTGPLYRGLHLEDIALARRGGRVVGTMAFWDQASFKQDVVDGYGPALRLLRPIYDAVARAIGAAPLPRRGEPIRAGFAALTCVAGDDPAVFRPLLADCLARARQRGLDWLMVGLADRDPLLPVARRLLHVTYRADLFAASWGSPARLDELDGRVPHVEIAAL